MRICFVHLGLVTLVTLSVVVLIPCNGQNSAIAQSSSAAEQLYQQGQEQYQSGKFQTAIDLWQQAITLYQQNGNRVKEGYTFVNIGFAFNNMNNYILAAEAHSQGVTIAREISDPDLEALALYGLGSAYDGQGNYPQAIAEYQQSLTLARRTNYRRTEAQVLRAIAETYQSQAKYAEAIEFYQQSLKLAEEIDPREQGRIFNSLGALYDQLGNYQEALNSYQRSIEIARQVPDRANEGAALLGIGNVYSAMGDRNRASQYWQSSLIIAREIEDSALETIVSNALRSASSEDIIDQARAGGDRSLEASGLEGQGINFQNRRDYPKALAAYQQSLIIFQEIGNREEEGELLSRIGQVLSAQNETALAIIFFKQSIKVYEAIRKDNRSLPMDLQESYTLTVADSYRQLADLLLQENRILEAQQVLDLLKIQELNDYFQDIQRSPRTEDGIDTLPDEQAVVEQLDELKNQAIVLGQELAELRQIPTSRRTLDQQQRIIQISEQQRQLTRQLVEFARLPEIVALIAELTRLSEGETIDPANLRNVSDELRQIGQDVVLLYPLILPNRLELIITTPNSPPIRRTVAVSQTQLNRAIVEYRQALNDPSSNPLPAAQKLSKKPEQKQSSMLRMGNCATSLLLHCMTAKNGLCNAFKSTILPLLP
jgi:tetratricopeptide (TPR) repeat protein